MLNQKEALDRLNREKAFEDKIASNLYNYYLVILEDINGLSEFQKSKIREQLNLLAHESEIHSNMFGELIGYVLENGETVY